MKIQCFFFEALTETVAWLPTVHVELESSSARLPTGSSSFSGGVPSDIGPTAVLKVSSAFSRIDSFYRKWINTI